MARSITAGTMSVVILAILAGLVCAYVFQTTMRKKPDVQAPPPPQKVTVPFASVDLPAGRTISLGDISLYQMTPEQSRERLSSPELTMLSPEQIIGRIIRTEIKQGEPFLTTSLFREGERPDISQLLKPGFRAYNIILPARGGPVVREGDQVDVLFRSDPRKGTEDQLPIPETTVTLLEGVEVIAFDLPRILSPQAASSDSGVRDLRPGAGRTSLPPPMATLAVTLEQANILQTVEGRGELSLIARATDDAATGVATRGDKLTLEDLLGIEAPPPPPPLPPPPPEPAPPPPTVVFVTEAYRRGTRDLNMFREKGSTPTDPQIRELPTFDPAILSPAESGDLQ